jgi:glycosyltransferase involved in cell wall biosynthesis
VITYTKKDAESLQKIFGEKNVIVRPYTCDPQKNQIILPKILSEIPKIFISIRLNSSQKNLKFLLKMSNYLKYKIDIYGSNPPKNFEQTLQKKYKNLNYKGTYTNSMIQDIYNSYDFSLLVSKFEGWPFVSTESIQYGCPTILRNTFPSAEFFTANNNGLLIPKKFNPKRAALLINEYIENMKPEEYSKISERCIELAKENLLFEK